MGANIVLKARGRTKFTVEELAYIQNKITKLMQRCEQETGVKISTKGTINYIHLQWWLAYVLRRFNYTTDTIKFSKDDFWDTAVFNVFMLDDAVYDDCDGAGYCLIEGLIRIFAMYKNNVYRVACAAETGEGHFVAWAKATDGVTYQVENRVRKPRSLRYMHDLGYEYWYYSSMAKAEISKNKWHNADNKVAKLIYNTPSNLAADKPEFAFSKILRVDKSKDLALKWGQALFAGVTATYAFVRDNVNEVVMTVQASKGDLANILDVKTVSIVMFVTSMIGLYIRAVTNKDVDMKKDYDG